MPASWFPMAAPPPAAGTGGLRGSACGQTQRGSHAAPGPPRCPGPRAALPAPSGPARRRCPGPAARAGPRGAGPPQHSPAQAEPGPPAPEAVRGSEAGLGAAEPAPPAGRGRGGAVSSHPAPAGGARLSPRVRGGACAVPAGRLLSPPGLPAS